MEGSSHTKCYTVVLVLLPKKVQVKVSPCHFTDVDGWQWAEGAALPAEPKPGKLQQTVQIPLQLVVCSRQVWFFNI